MLGLLCKFGNSGGLYLWISDDLIPRGNNLLFQKRSNKFLSLFFINLFILKQAPSVKNKIRLEFNVAGCLDCKNESLSQATK